MSLFGDGSRPKGITKEELHYVRGALKSSSMGHGTEELTDRQADEIIHRLELCLDTDTDVAKRHHWEQAGAAEVAEIEDQIDHDRDNDLRLTETQKKHIHTVLDKYVDLNKHGGLFSL